MNIECEEEYKAATLALDDASCFPRANNQTAKRMEQITRALSRCLENWGTIVLPS